METMTVTRHGRLPYGWGQATFSGDGRYRYELRREWPAQTAGPLRTMVFVMFNPSDAGPDRDDPTITRCRQFARRGLDGVPCNRLIAVNLHAYKATDPSLLLAVADPVGPGNDEWIERAVSTRNAVVVCAWGAHAARAQFKARALEVLDIVEQCADWYSLGRTASGHPPHPVRLPALTPLIPGVRPFSRPRRSHAAR